MKHTLICTNLDYDVQIRIGIMRKFAIRISLASIGQLCFGALFISMNKPASETHSYYSHC